MPHTPTRQCRVCRQRKPKSHLRRWVVSGGGLVEDVSQKAPGRGYYSCSDKCTEILPRTVKVGA